MPVLSSRPLESAIERAFVRKMRERYPGIKIRKMNGEGYRSWPDRMVCVPGGKPFMIEFKRPGGGLLLTPGQEDLHRELTAMGYDLGVYDDAEAAVIAVEVRLRG